MSRMLRITCIRVLASAAVWLAGNAWGGSAPTQEIRVSLRRWSDWWMNEVGRQSVPSPQLLHVIGQKDGWLCPADDIYVFPSGFGYRHEWHQANAGLISTEAFVLPSAAQHMSNWEFGAFFVSHDYDGTLPALCLKPSQEEAPAFHWLRDIAVPGSIRSAVFNSSGYGEDLPLKAKLPRLLYPGCYDSWWPNPFSDPRERDERCY